MQTLEILDRAANIANMVNRQGPHHSYSDMLNRQGHHLLKENQALRNTNLRDP